MIPLLATDSPFPPLSAASDEYGGLLAAGADLSPQRLLEAYRRGIFPWGRLEGYPLWYSPDPRMVLFPDEFRLSRSLRKTLRSGRLSGGQPFRIACDENFAGVIGACAQTPRPGQDGTWIDDAMRAAYLHLHELGWAHSVEVHAEGDLVGGLYGLAIGRMFYGESMFAHRDNASKIAFAYLIRLLQNQGFGMIDCQMHTPHLASLGGREIPRADFCTRLQTLIGQGPAQSVWTLADCFADAPIEPGHTGGQYPATGG